MNKNIVISLIFALLVSLPIALADEWDDLPDIERAWDGQKTITNQDFEKVMDALQEKTKKKEARQRKRKIKKISGGGKSLHEEMNPDNKIPELSSLRAEPEELLINLPVHLIVDGKKLDKGYYNVTARRDANKDIYLNLYQAHYLISSIKATETEDDFSQERVDFADVQTFNDSFVKLIFGSIDFNAYALIPYEE